MATSLARLRPRHVLVACVVLLPILHVASNVRAINHDVAMYLTSADLILDGEVPYVDVVEVNPPMVMYVSTVPVLIAHAVDVSPVVAMQLLVIGLFVASLVATSHVVRRSARATPTLEIAAVLALAAASALVAANGEWGQREHLFMLAACPFVLLRTEAFSSVPWPVRALLGACVGLTACFKPWFLLVVALPELFELLRNRDPRRLVRAEVIACAAVGFAFAAHFLVMGSMRDAFFDRWVPFVLSTYERRLNESPIELLETGVRGLTSVRSWVRAPSWLLLSGCVAAAAGARLAVRRRHALVDAYSAPLTAAAVGAAAAYVMQGKEWWYHAVPLLGFAFLVVAATTASWLDAAPADAATTPRRARVVAICLLVVTVALAGNSLRPRRVEPAASAVAQLVEAHSDVGDRVLVLSAAVTPAYPALTTTERRPGTRYVWMFPAWFAETERQRGDVVRDIDEDIDELRPSLVLIDETPCPGGCNGTTLLAYLFELGLDRDAFDDYERVDRVGDWTVLTRLARGR